MRNAAVQNNRALDALPHRVDATFHLRNHSPGDRAVRDPCLDICQSHRGDQVLIDIQNASDIRQHQQPLRVQCTGDRRGNRVRVDIVSLAVLIRAHRRDDRNQPAAC